MQSWTLEVARDDHARTELTAADAPEPADGEALLRVAKVGMTANNVTYAVLGDAFRYWEFFPASPGHGRVPLWGFAEVVASRAPGVTEGERLYGYLPPAGHLTVRPERTTPNGFRDGSAHRAPLPGVYNAYDRTTGDPAYEEAREDLQVLYRPLFATSFLLTEWLRANDCHGAATLVLSSASSKTAYGTAFGLRGQRRLVGLTSPGNLDYTASLGVYDEVLPYDAVGSLDRTPTTYLDFSGSNALRTALHEHLRTELVHDAVVGVTHQDPGPIGTLAGARPQVFFAPEQAKARTAEWGREGFAERFGAAWRAFVPAVEQWVDVVRHHGPEALRDLWLKTLRNETAPRDGHVVTF